jgi:hypothetical protein
MALAKGKRGNVAARNFPRLAGQVWTRLPEEFRLSPTKEAQWAR